MILKMKLKTKVILWLGVITFNILIFLWLYSLEWNVLKNIGLDWINK